MKEEIYCPNPHCFHHQSPSKDVRWYKKRGFTVTKREGKTQLYQCKKCHRTFALSYFTINHYGHHKVKPEILLKQLISCSGIRDMSRAMDCDPKVISHRIARLSQKINGICSREISQLELKESVSADGLENFILSQYFPTNVNILVGKKSQFVYYFNAYHFKRKGKCTDEQKKKKASLYEIARFEQKAASNRFNEILDFLWNKVNSSSLSSFILDTDENPIYASQFRYHPNLSAKVTHRKTNSKIERNYQNKLFSCNYIDRQIRKDLAEYTRETVQFGRNMNNCMDRFSCYIFWHNFMKPYRINKRKSAYSYHGECAGFSLKKIKEIVDAVISGPVVRECESKQYLTNFQRKHWDRELLNPMNVAMV